MKASLFALALLVTLAASACGADGQGPLEEEATDSSAIVTGCTGQHWLSVTPRVHYRNGFQGWWLGWSSRAARCGWSLNGSYKGSIPCTGGTYWSKDMARPGDTVRFVGSGNLMFGVCSKTLRRP